MKVKVTVFSSEKYDRDWPGESDLIVFAQFIQRHIESIPDECRNSAKIDIDVIPNYGDPCAKMDIYYLREETEEEVAISEKKERDAQSFQEKKERAILAQLKLKYESDGKSPAIESTHSNWQWSDTIWPMKCRIGCQNKQENEIWACIPRFL